MNVTLGDLLILIGMVFSAGVVWNRSSMNKTKTIAAIENQTEALKLYIQKEITSKDEWIKKMFEAFNTRLTAVEVHLGLRSKP
jgi:3-keto-L-gulonate-6-phosphate decarboxylase